MFLVKRFKSFKEFEEGLINEELPQMSLEKNSIRNNLINKYNKRRGINRATKGIAIAMLLLAISMPAITKGNLSYAEVYKNIAESIYGKVVAFLPDKDDGGFKFIETERTEDEIEKYEKISMMNVAESYDEIKEQLEPGECARLIYLEFYEATGGSTYIVQQPIVFNDINSIRDYGMDVSVPKYIPKGYKLKEARLNFTPRNISEEDMARYDIMAEEAKKQNLVYTWEKVEDKIESNLVFEYIPKIKAEGNDSIYVEINLTDFDAATQALVFEDSDYEVEITNIGDKEVMEWNYGSEDFYRHYTFKMPNRKYKTYDITIAKDNSLLTKEIENMIKSFE